MILRSCWLDDDRSIGLQEAARMINEVERSRGGKFRFLRDRHRYVRGRAFLRKSLATITGTRPELIELRYEAGGKPFLPTGPHFNLAHSGPLAVLGISHDRRVGVDVECLSGRFDTRGLAEECFSRSEVKVLEGLAGSARTERFFAFWTAKEARLKLTGEGLSRDPRSIELNLASGWPAQSFDDRAPRPSAAFQYVRMTDFLCCIATPMNSGSANSTAGSTADVPRLSAP